MKILEIDDLIVNGYDKEILNFSGKTISVFEGDKVGIIGRNGSGKTTLINSILGEISYKSGKIIRKFSYRDIGIVFQRNEYSDLLKVGELIEMVFLKKINDKEIQDFLDNFDLRGLKNRYIKNLSIGEIQRLTVALVISQEKKVYFLDELTSGLDYEKRQNLMSKCKEYTRNQTVFQVTHYFEEIEDWATRIIVLNQGKLIFSGTIQEFKNKYKHFAFYTFSDYTEKKIDYEIISNYGLLLNNNILVIENKEMSEKVSEILNFYDIKFQYSLQNIYSSYLLALEGEDI